MFEDIFEDGDLELAKAFVKEEAKEYKVNLYFPPFFTPKMKKDFVNSKLLNPVGWEWAVKVERAIYDELKKKFPKGCNYVIFISNTNMGQTQRELKVTPKKNFFKPEKGNAVVMFSSWATTPEKWGAVQKEERK